MIMIIKRGTRAARSTLGNDFADVWYTFVRSFNKLKVPTRSLSEVFSDDPDKTRENIEKQFLGHVDSLLGQLEILQGFVSKEVKKETEKIKETLLSLNADLSKAKDYLEKIKENKSEIKKEGYKSTFGVIRGKIESHLLNARDNIYLLASLKK